MREPGDRCPSTTELYSGNDPTTPSTASQEGWLRSCSWSHSSPRSEHEDLGTPSLMRCTTPSAGGLCPRSFISVPSSQLVSVEPPESQDGQSKPSSALRAFVTRTSGAPQCRSCWVGMSGCYPDTSLAVPQDFDCPGISSAKHGGTSQWPVQHRHPSSPCPLFARLRARRSRPLLLTPAIFSPWRPSTLLRRAQSLLPIAQRRPSQARPVSCHRSARLRRYPTLLPPFAVLCVQRFGQNVALRCFPETSSRTSGSFVS